MSSRVFAVTWPRRRRFPKDEAAVRVIAEWESGKEQSDSSRQRLTEIHRLTQALAEVMPEEQIGAWLLEPNEVLGGFKPLEVIERGEIDRIWRLTYALP
jgi:hypothetical protein